MNMQKLKEVTLCRLCLETVTNPICVNCLFEDVQNWLLSSNHVDLLMSGFSLNERIEQIIQSEDNFGICLVCKKETSQISCPCCYLFEIFSLFNAVNPSLAKAFEKSFSFDFSYHHGY